MNKQTNKRTQTVKPWGQAPEEEKKGYWHLKKRDTWLRLGLRNLQHGSHGFLKQRVPLALAPQGELNMAVCTEANTPHPTKAELALEDHICPCHPQDLP